MRGNGLSVSPEGEESESGLIPQDVIKKEAVKSKKAVFIGVKITYP